VATEAGAGLPGTEDIEADLLETEDIEADLPGTEDIEAGPEEDTEQHYCFMLLKI